MRRSLIVGNDDCSTAKVHSILRSSNSFNLLDEKWTDIARDLKIPEANIKVIKGRLGSNQIGLSDAIKEILDLWVGSEGDCAYLENLIKILEHNRLAACAQQLQKEFNCPTEVHAQFSIIQPETSSSSANVSPSVNYRSSYARFDRLRFSQTYSNGLFFTLVDVDDGGNILQALYTAPVHIQVQATNTENSLPSLSEFWFPDRINIQVFANEARKVSQWVTERTDANIQNLFIRYSGNRRSRTFKILTVMAGVTLGLSFIYYTNRFKLLYSKVISPIIERCRETLKVILTIDDNIKIPDIPPPVGFIPMPNYIHKRHYGSEYHISRIMDGYS